MEAPHPEPKGTNGSSADGDAGKDRAQLSALLPAVAEALPPASPSADAVKEFIVQRARQQEPDYVKEEGRDFQCQAFTKCKPLMKLVGVDNPSFTEEDETWGLAMRMKAVNHVAIDAYDVDTICRFYTKVLGFRKIPRPNIGFRGHWLKGCGMMLHIIQKDPTVPYRFNDWKEQYKREPEAWFIRRGSHIALEVEDFEVAEATLKRHGVEYSRHVLPDANMQQLFFFDPEGNGVEVGRYEDTWHFLRKHGRRRAGSEERQGGRLWGGAAEAGCALDGAAARRQKNCLTSVYSNGNLLPALPPASKPARPFCRSAPCSLHA